MGSYPRENSGVPSETFVRLPFWELMKRMKTEDRTDDEDPVTHDSEQDENEPCDKESAECIRERTDMTDSTNKDEKTEDDASMDDQDEFDMMPRMDATSLTVRAGCIFCVTVSGKDKKSVDAVRPFDHTEVIVLDEEHGSHIGDDGKTVYTVKFSFRIQTIGRFEVMKCGYDYLHVSVVPGPVFVPKSSWKPEDDEKFGVIGHVCAVESSVRYIFHPRDEFGNPATIDRDFLQSLSIRCEEANCIKLGVECVGDSGVRLLFTPYRECFVHCTLLFNGKECALFRPITIVALTPSALQSLESNGLTLSNVPCNYQKYSFFGYPFDGDIIELCITVSQNKVMLYHVTPFFDLMVIKQPFALFDINEFLEVITESFFILGQVVLIFKQNSPEKNVRVAINRSDALRVVAAIKMSLIRQARCGSMERGI